MLAVKHFLFWALLRWKAPKNFDPDSYLRQNPDVKASGMNPLFHYITYGKKEGRNFVEQHYITNHLNEADMDSISRSSLFDESFYLLNNPDIVISNFEPIWHFLVVGGFEGRKPSENFDSAFYLEKYPDVKASGINPLIHYFRFGSIEGRMINSNQFNQNKILNNYKLLINESGLFDESFYLVNNPDILKSNDDPVLHYLIHGGFEGRKPSENFDSAFYLEKYPDVKASGINPLIHYFRFGSIEGRMINSNQFNQNKILNNYKLLINESGLFDESFYLVNNPDILKSNDDPVLHYLIHGGFEGRKPSENFDSAFYLEKYPDVKASGINPLIHYFRFGSI
ncbi:MAG: hypothetical protein ACOYOV_10540, partial [Bacteroidales bacterium]